jgi:regulator-associated protein of mTOR
MYAEQQAMAAFVLAVIVDGHRGGQKECLQCGLISICLLHIQNSLSTDGQRDPLLLRWLCLCLGKLWEGFDLAQQQGLVANAPTILMQLLSESQPEVSYLKVYAEQTF